MSNVIKPACLKPGDKIALVSPSMPGPAMAPSRINQAVQTLESMGFIVQWAPHARMKHGHHGATIQQRADDINNSFADPDIKAILCTIGGWTANGIIPYLDFEIINLIAKKDMIVQLKKSVKSPFQAEKVIKLDQMLITTEVELAGLLAKKNAIQKSYEQLAKLMESFQKEGDAHGKINDLKLDMKKARKSVQLLDSKLADPSADWLPVKVVDNKVVIYPVR